jgi:hypothetical protein
MRSIWVGIDSTCDGTRVLATAGSTETILKARLSATAQHPRAVPALLEALALWQGVPVRAAVVVDGNDGSSTTRLSLDGFADFGGQLLYTARVRPRAQAPHRTGSTGSAASTTCASSCCSRWRRGRRRVVRADPSACCRRAHRSRARSRARDRRRTRAPSSRWSACPRSLWPCQSRATRSSTSSARSTPRANWIRLRTPSGVACPQVSHSTSRVAPASIAARHSVSSVRGWRCHRRAGLSRCRSAATRAPRWINSRGSRARPVLRAAAA